MNRIFEIDGVKVNDLIKEFGSPLYVYNRNTIENRYSNLFKSINYKKKKILYACKANTNIEILKILNNLGSGIDAVSPGEVFLALEAGFDPQDILFTGDNCTIEEIAFCVEHNVPVNIGSLFHLQKYGEMFPGTNVSVRINPDVIAGHHGHVITGGPKTKFGIYYDETENILKIADNYNLNIFGVHFHIGSGILEADKFMEAVEIILSCAKYFPNLKFIDIGGGIGVPYRENQSPINIEDFGKKLSNRFNKYTKENKSDVSLFLEPGRYIVAESGFLLVTVNNEKNTPLYKFVGVDSGFNHLIRPMAYGSYHEIINGSNMNGELESLIVAGNLCESGDVFTRNENGVEPRDISKVRYGDILVICNAGAYGYAMASRYNSRLLPAEVLIENGNPRLIRRRETFSDLLHNTKCCCS